MVARLCIRLLGSFQVTLDRQAVISFASDKVRALLAYLVLEADRPHRRQALAGLLWPDFPERVARTNLRNTLYRLRRAIRDGDASEPAILVRGDALRFNESCDHWSDLSEFLRLASLPSRALGVGIRDRLLQLYRGEFLNGVAVPDSASFEDWLQGTRRRLQELAVSSLGECVEAAETEGALSQALSLARKAVLLDPYHEGANLALIRLLARAGNRAEALQHYQLYARLLRDDLDARPGPGVSELRSRIQRGSFGPALVSDDAGARLPHSLVPLVGRGDEIAHLLDRLADPSCRLLTLVGPGGVGKTRLALEVAARAAPMYPDGVRHVPLSGVQTVDALAPAIASALGITFVGGGLGSPSPSQAMRQLTAFVSDKQMLLVLDGFEHLAAATPQLLDLLTNTGRLNVMVTSRARLGSPGEEVFRVEALRCPGEEDELEAAGDARELFLQAARRVNSGRSWTLDDDVAVARVCRQVGGLPLALLLAASWTELLPPDEIAARLADAEQALDMLEADNDALPDRQRSMRGVFDSSWILLDERLRGVLAALSRFAGSFTSDAAASVAGASLRDILALVDRSLLHADADGRFSIHDLLAEYLRAQLSTDPACAEAVSARHAAYYAGLVEAWDAHMRAIPRVSQVADVRPELNNCLLAWEWACGRGDAHLLDRLASGLGLFYERFGLWQEAERLFGSAGDRQRARAASHAGPNGQALRVLAKLRGWQTHFLTPLQRRPESRSLLDEAGICLREAAAMGEDVQREEAMLAYEEAMACPTPRSEVDRSLFDKSLKLFREIGDPRWQATLLGYMAHRAPSSILRVQYAEEALPLWRQLGEGAGMARCLSHMAQAESAGGRFDTAERLALEAFDLCRETSAVAFAASTLEIVGAVLLVLGLDARAVEAYQMMLDTGTQRGLPAIAQIGRQGLATVALYRGEYALARMHAEAGVALDVDSPPLADLLTVLAFVDLSEGDPGQAAMLAERAIEQARQRNTAPPLARAMLVRGESALFEGDLAIARLQICRALRTQARDYGMRWRFVCAVARLLAAEGQVELGLELWSLARTFPMARRSRYYHDFCGRHVEAAARKLPLDVVAAARQRGQGRDLAATMEELPDLLGCETTARFVE